MLTGKDPSKDADEELEESVPWTLILRHREYPKERILAITDKSTILDYWMNQIKEVGTALCYI